MSSQSSFFTFGAQSSGGSQKRSRDDEIIDKKLCIFDEDSNSQSSFNLSQNRSQPQPPTQRAFFVTAAQVPERRAPLVGRRLVTPSPMLRQSFSTKNNEEIQRDHRAYMEEEERRKAEEDDEQERAMAEAVLIRFQNQENPGYSGNFTPATPQIQPPLEDWGNNTLFEEDWDNNTSNMNNSDPDNEWME